MIVLLLRYIFSHPFSTNLIIIDECHRGSAADDSAWREILEYFSSATQIGMTATPKETKYVSSSHYFGPPVYTYSLREGIDDLRYYATLRSLVEEHDDAAGKKILEKVLASLDDRGRPVLAKFDKWGDPIDEHVLSLNDLREEMAARIAALSR